MSVGTIHSSGIRCENVEKLTFSAERFNLIISQDVFEHVCDPWKGFAEIHRVLKNGGYHVFTVLSSKVLEKSRTRARLMDGRLEHLIHL